MVQGLAIKLSNGSRNQSIIEYRKPSPGGSSGGSAERAIIHIQQTVQMRSRVEP